MDKRIAGLGKQEKYHIVTAEIKAVLAGENNMIAKMATVVCLLAQAFPDRFYWTGFYIVDPQREGELVIGPYQGTLGCLRIAFGRGVCGTAARTGQTQIIDDVKAIDNHIACDDRTESEIVLPVFDRIGRLIAVLDIDAITKEAFDPIDQMCLEALLVDLFAV